MKPCRRKEFTTQSKKCRALQAWMGFSKQKFILDDLERNHLYPAEADRHPVPVEGKEISTPYSGVSMFWKHWASPPLENIRINWLSETEKEKLMWLPPPGCPSIPKQLTHRNSFPASVLTSFSVAASAYHPLPCFGSISENNYFYINYKGTAFARAVETDSLRLPRDFSFYLCADPARPARYN